MRITENDILQGYENIKLIIDHLIDKYNIKHISSEIAPSTYKGMVSYYKDHGQFLVYSGGDHGFLGQKYNIKFRALHDYTHYIMALKFTYEDELELSTITKYLFKRIAKREFNLDAFQCFVVGSIISAEIGGQIKYHMENKKFVDDQKSFILNQLVGL